jgi:hypothetical protein
VFSDSTFSKVTSILPLVQYQTNITFIITSNMSYNQILAKKTVKTIMKNGQQITLSVATRTSNWTRPEPAVDAIVDPFTKAVEAYAGQLPEDTKDICARLCTSGAFIFRD